MLQEITQQQVAIQLGGAQSSISRLGTMPVITGKLEDRPRSERPRETTQREYRRIRLTHLRNRFQTAVKTAANTPDRHNNRRIHPKTDRNRLRESRYPRIDLTLEYV
ncbi:MAG: hypothetical protein ABW185_08160 [Sedimenticola sp.]